MKPPVEAAARTYDRSLSLHADGSRHLAGGVSTAFRMFERPVPLVCERAEGCEWVDVDGNHYVDFVCGFGPVILGHGDPAVCDAVARAAASVQQVGGQHRAELELAELLCSLVPSFECVRISLSGSEAVHAATRLARGATGRPLIVKFAGHYHGWLDGIYTGIAHRAPGLPESLGQLPEAMASTVVIDWNEPEQLKALFDRAGDQIAAVIMEPLPCNQGVIFPDAGYLEFVRELTRSTGSVLIFDEVITGFRLGLGGAQEQFGVVPDLTVVAKAMGNGFPVSAVGGRSDLMDLVATNRVVHAGTYNAGGVSVAAALATLGRLMEHPEAYQRMNFLGNRLMDGLEASAHDHGLSFVTAGPGPVFFGWFAAGDVRSFGDHLSADAAKYARFAEQMLAAGVRIIPSGRWYLTAAHDESHIEGALEAADSAFANLS